MQTFRNIQRSSVAALLILLILGAFFAVSWHVFCAQSDDHFHANNHCQVCAWYYFTAWITSGSAFILCITSSKHRHVHSNLFKPFRFSSKRSRAPPVC
jgi:hypothetical protein